MNSLLKALLIFLLWMVVEYTIPFAFAAEIVGAVDRAMQIEVKKLESPNSTLPPEKNCDNCPENQQIKTEIKPSQIPSPSPSASTSASPSVQPTTVPIEEKQTPSILKIWNWVLNLFS